MIEAFNGSYRFLLNFWPAVVMLDGVEYPTVEHAYQAAKVPVESRKPFQDKRLTPGQAKRLSRTFPIPGDWGTRKVGIMRALVTQKFQHENLKLLLLRTGTQALVEGNTWGDTFWGVYRGKGQNYLGAILMEVRESLKTR